MTQPNAAVGQSTATVLFTDVVASTEARVALGEEAADELRRVHDRLVRFAVEAGRGRVVKGTGDGLLATFAAASDALSAAVASQRAIARHNRSARRHSLSVRVGLAAGDIVFEEGDCFGLPVVEAARLCGAASGGQILASEVVRLLAGSRGGHTFVPIGGLHLKGLATPLTVVEVVWVSVSTPATPLPAALDTRKAFRFVGREQYLTTLVDIWKQAATGGRRVVLLTGEAGIGKTRLAAELAQVAHHEGAVVLYGRCDEELGIPYQPFAQALRAYAATCPREELRSQVGSLGAELVRLVPTLPDRLPGLGMPLRAEPNTERYRLFEAVVELLSGASDASPVLLVLDDLHWGDRPTLALLRHILDAPDFGRLLVIGTYRDSEVERGGPLAELPRQPGVEEFSLQGLGDDAVAELLIASAGLNVDVAMHALARAVHHLTEGNAFFVGEVLRHLREVGGVPARSGVTAAEATVAKLGVPKGVREVVGRRLARLPGSAGDVLAVAAVIGREFDAGLLVQVTDEGADAVLEALEHAEKARLITPARRDRADRFLFSHALVRSTMYDELPASRRALLHHRIGEKLEVRGGTEVASELAHHFAAAGPAGDPGKAVTYGMAAGNAALDRLAYEQAAAFYGLALEALECADMGDGWKTDILVARGCAWRQAGDMDRARDDFVAAAGAARRGGDAGALARAALGVGETSSVWGVDELLVSLLEEALEAIGQRDLSLRARLLGHLGQAVYFSGRGRRLALTGEAVETARAAGDAAALADVLCARHVTLSGPDGLDERLAVAEEVVRLAQTSGAPELALQGHAWLLADLLEAGDGAGVDRELAAHAELAQELRQPLYLRDAAVWRGMRAVLKGCFTDAEQAIDQALAIGEQAGDAYARAIHVDQCTLLAYHSERTDDLIRLRPAFLEWFGDLREPARQTVDSFIALVDLRLGERERAHAAFDAVVGSVPDLPRDTVWLVAVCLISELCAEVGDDKWGNVLYDRLAPHAGQVAVVDRAWMCLGSVSQYLGLLAGRNGRLQDARSHFEAALLVHQRLDARPFLAWSQCELAATLLALADPDLRARVRALAGDALATAVALRLPARAAKARRLLDEA